jgi:hypothetical protein
VGSNEPDPAGEFQVEIKRLPKAVHVVETETVGVLANGPNEDNVIGKRTSLNEDNVIGKRTSLVGLARDVDGAHAPSIQR